MRRVEWAFALAVISLVIVAFGIFYGGASALSSLVPWRVDVSVELDRRVPFLPWMSVVYLSMDVLLLLSAIVLVEPRRLAAFGALLIVELLVASVFFVAMPAHDIFPPRHVNGAVSTFFGLADTLNLERNYFPSLHVAFSVTAALVYSRTRPRLTALWWLWAVAITASTMLIHEHGTLDVLGGIALAGGTFTLLFERMVRFDFAEVLKTEWLLATELLRFTRRHRRYGVIALGLYLVALRRSELSFRGRRALRSGFVLLQVIDDVLDGDRPSAEPPLDFARRALRFLEGHDVADDRLSRMVRAFTTDAPPTALPIARALIATMMRDAERMATRARWTEAQIHEQLRQTFAGSLDIVLCCARSPLSITSAPALIELLGWCSVVRDLDEDLHKGLWNVPAGIRVEDPAERAAWLARESDRARALWPKVEAELAALGDARASGFLRVLARSTRKYLQPSPEPTRWSVVAPRE